jgi:hypothetical protein
MQDMNGCKGAHSGSYGRIFANNLKGQSPHEVTYPYLDTQPRLSCPASKPAIYNSGAYVKTPMEDYQCSETKLKQLVTFFSLHVFFAQVDNLVIILLRKSYRFLLMELPSHMFMPVTELLETTPTESFHPVLPRTSITLS